MLVGTLVQVLLTVYLPILIGQAVDGIDSGWSGLARDNWQNGDGYLA